MDERRDGGKCGREKRWREIVDKENEKTHLAIVGNTQTETTSNTILFKAILIKVEQSLIAANLTEIHQESGTNEIFREIVVIEEVIGSFLEQLDTAKIQGRDNSGIHVHKTSLHAESHLGQAMAEVL